MQINRLFEMIYLLLDRESITASTLASHFEVSPRTIYRDVELLSTAGIPIYMKKGKGGGISLLPDFVLNKAVLTEREKTDILAALQAVDAVNLETENATVKKMVSLLGADGTDWIEVDFSSWENTKEESETFTTVKRAILEKCVLQFHYHSGENSLQRVVEPLKLCFKGQGWYLYAYCRLRKDFRFFKLRRMKELMVLTQTFYRDVPTKIFDTTAVFQEELISITLKLSKEMAYRVYDELSIDQVLPDGSFLATLRMPQGPWIYDYVATFGEHCEVIAPEHIRTQLKERLQKTLAVYL